MRKENFWQLIAGYIVSFYLIKNNLKNHFSNTRFLLRGGEVGPPQYILKIQFMYQRKFIKAKTGN